MLTRPRAAGIAAAYLILLLLAVPAYAQVGRATITGIVSDSTGAVVASVEITVTNVATGVTYKTTTNAAGNYTVGALAVGPYAVSYSAAGFKELVRSGINLETGQIARLDVTLEVGALVQKMEVTAEVPMLQTETAIVSKNVASSSFSLLPLSFSGGRNLMEFNTLVPGVVSGGTYAMHVQGAPGTSHAALIDGTNSFAGFLTANMLDFNISPEAVQEMSTITGSPGAEFGRTGGGVLNFTLKSGTNRIHGSGFYYLRNEVLNANDWNNNLQLAADPTFSKPTTARFLRPRRREELGGFSLGGPIYLPKIYDGRDKTFIFFTFEDYSTNTADSPNQLGKNVPLPEMFDGNLSRLLGKQVATDALGRPVAQGQLYDPSTLRLVNGQYVADPFLGNIIPPSQTSQVARNFKSIFNKYYQPATTDLVNNFYTTRYAGQIRKNFSTKLDHSLSPKLKFSGWFDWSDMERPENQNDGLWSPNDPNVGGPLAMTKWHINLGYRWNANADWVITPSLLNHTSFADNFEDNYYTCRNVGQGQATQWGIKGVGGGFPEAKWTAPYFVMGSSPVVTYSNFGCQDARDFNYAGYILTDTLSWQLRNHSIKFGMEANWFRAREFDYDNSGGTFNFSAVSTAIPGQTYTSLIGNSFASFLLGQVNSASVRPEFHYGSRRSYASLFVQDSWKVTPRLTLNLGLRWSGNTPMYEDDDHIASFDTTVTDPISGLPGAVVYMGSGPGRIGKRSPAPSDWKDFAPNFGFAYRLNERTVMRGGYGMTFTPEAIGWSIIPNNFVAGFQPVNSVPSDSKGQYKPVFQIDNGYPGVTQPPNLDPSYANRYGATRISPDYAKAGYVQHFNFGFQFEPLKDLLVETDWRASKGTRLHDWGAVYPNQIRSQELLRGSVLGKVIDSPQAAAAAGLPYPFAGFSGLGANTLMPYPQLATRTLSAWGDPVGFSRYHSGNLIVTKRGPAGTYLYGAYTFSKDMTDTNDVTGWQGSSTGLQDTYNRRLYKALAPLDSTHNIKSAIVWDLPVGRNRRFLAQVPRWANPIVSGWIVSALLIYTSGTPLGAPASLITPVGWNGPGVLSNFNTPPGGFNVVWDSSKFNPWNPNDPGNRYFDASAFSNPLPQQLGNSPIRFPEVRLPWAKTQNATLTKQFTIRERAKLQLRLEMLNFTNRHSFAAPEMNRNQTYFGNIRTASGYRTGQVGMRLDW